MVESYKFLKQGGECEIIEKKSRFIAASAAVETEEEALAFIEERKKKHRDASHNCSAFIVGVEQPLERCSDDGEPSQTAGRPMLDVLSGSGICNICVVATRYFGGTLLGTGGLVRAYSRAVKECLEVSETAVRCLADRICVSTDYTNAGKIQYLAAQMGIMEAETVYTDQVVITYLVPVSRTDAWIKKLTETSNGQAVVQKMSTDYYVF